MAKKLKRYNYLAGAIHCYVAQNKREKVLKGFKDGSLRILVATVVAARGLDTDSVDNVIKFDAPSDPDTYMHRIGRTGSAGKEGAAISFFLPEERKDIRGLERCTEKTIDRLDIEIVHKEEPEVKSFPSAMGIMIGPEETARIHSQSDETKVQSGRFMHRPKPFPF